MRLLLKNFLLISFLILPAVHVTQRVYAHGGEDHGAAPKTTTTEKGVVVRTVRMGELEVTLKHSALEPDVPSHANLFFTKFETNEPLNPSGLEVAAESAGGSIIPVSFEKSSLPGSYMLMLPAMTEGEYTFRASLTNAGKTTTATFSGIQVAHSSAAGSVSDSWTQVALSSFFVLIGLALLAALVYFAVRAIRSEPSVPEEAVSV